MTLFLDEFVAGSFAKVHLHLQETLVFFVVIPQKVIVDIWDEAFINGGFVGLLIEFIVVKFELNLADMGLGNPYRPQEAPSHAKQIVAVVLVLFVAKDQGLVVKVQDFEQNDGVGVEE